MRMPCCQVQHYGEILSPSIFLLGAIVKSIIYFRDVKEEYKPLISAQRYTISQMLKQQFSLRHIAKTSGVSVSIVSRVLQRNSHQWIYQPKKAELLMREHHSYRKYHWVSTTKMCQYIDDHL